MIQECFGEIPIQIEGEKKAEVDITPAEKYVKVQIRLFTENNKNQISVTAPYSVKFNERMKRIPATRYEGSVWYGFGAYRSSIIQYAKECYPDYPFEIEDETESRHHEYEEFSADLPYGAEMRIVNLNKAIEYNNSGNSIYLNDIPYDDLAYALCLYRRGGGGSKSKFSMHELRRVTRQLLRLNGISESIVGYHISENLIRDLNQVSSNVYFFLMKPTISKQNSNLYVYKVLLGDIQYESPKPFLFPLSYEVGTERF